MTIAAARVRRKQGRAPGASAAAQASIAGPLLAWYDRHRRRLPWRAEPGETADPYLVWLSEIMLQQTTVATVIPYFERFRARWPDVSSLSAASLDDVLRGWAGLGYYARARNLHRCAQTVAGSWNGRFPDSEEALRTLPGIGRYTAAAIAAIAFGRHATPVDGNIERIVARLFAVADPLPAAKPRIQSLAEGITPLQRAGDFAQALMDLGATVCTPRRPACPACPIIRACAAERTGNPDVFPHKQAKVGTRLRRGAAFVAERADGHVLIRTRPARGLLGGMSEVPTSAWSPDFDAARALDDAPRFGPASRQTAWRELPGVVKHVFTHFPLELVVFLAAVPGRPPAPAGTRWVARRRLDEEALPTVMRKVLKHALEPL